MNIKKLQKNTNDYLNLLSKLEVLNPITTIKRGYTITNINNKSLVSIKEIKKDDIITTKLIDGKIESKVLKIYNDK